MKIPLINEFRALVHALSDVRSAVDARRALATAKELFELQDAAREEAFQRKMKAADRRIEAQNAASLRIMQQAVITDQRAAIKQAASEIINEMRAN